MCSFEIGGAERQAALLANHLAAEGAKVAVWAYTKPGPLCDLLDKRIAVKSVELYPELQNMKFWERTVVSLILQAWERRVFQTGTPLSQMLAPVAPEFQERKDWKRKAVSLISLAWEMRKFRPDALLPFTQVPNVDAGLIWKRTGAHVCLWNQRDAGIYFSGNYFEKRALDNDLVFAANAESGIAALRSRIGAEKPIAHIPNAVVLREPAKAAAQWRDELHLSGDRDFVAIMVANLHGRKDHANLIKAWKIVVEENRSEKRPVLLLAGRFDETDAALKSLVKELGIEGNVAFLGFVEDIAGLLKICDLGVFSSFTEGCPNGVLECMAAGLPIVATDIVGTREALGSDNPGLVLGGDPKAFAERVRDFLQDAAARRETGQRNRERSERFFGPDAMFSSYSDLLKRHI